MRFKYFDKPELFSGFIEDEAVCDICNTTTKCFDAGTFFGIDEIKAICPDCLASGKLNEKEIYTVSGDIEELKRQLKILHAVFTDQEIETIAAEKTKELEKTTPPVISWQDWNWPCADGDYCSFIGYGSKQLYQTLANGSDAKTLFNTSIYYELKEMSDAESLWAKALPGKEIKNYEESSEFGTLFYVFKSLNSDTVITIWDCD